MFRSEDKVIVPEPTPERVYQCALYLKKHDKGITRADLKKALTMPEIFEDKGDKIFDYTYGVFSELDLCSEMDGKIYPTEKLKEINSVHDFRKYCARMIFQWKDSLFSKVTSLYCKMAEDMLKVSKWDEVNMIMGQNEVLIHPNVLKGWRLWAPFLGCGYLNDYFMMPNWAQRMSDILEDQKDFPVSERIPIDKFIAWFVSQAPEVGESIEGAKIGLGVSNGLLTLNELGILRIITDPEANHWQMKQTGGSRAISHVEIVR